MDMERMRGPLGFGGACAIALAGGAAGQCPPQYVLLDLHEMLVSHGFEADHSAAVSITDDGRVVGSYDEPCDFPPCVVQRIVVWEPDNGIIDTPPGPNPDFLRGQARSINDHDQVVGYYLAGEVVQLMTPFMWDRTTDTFVELPRLSGEPAAALDINNSVDPIQIVGRRRDASPQAIGWQNGAVEIIQGPDEYSPGCGLDGLWLAPTGCAGVVNIWNHLKSALAINDAGIVVGRGHIACTCVGAGGGSIAMAPAYKLSLNTGDFTGLCDACNGPGCDFQGPPPDCWVSKAYDIDLDGTIVGEACPFELCTNGGQSLRSFRLPPGAPGNAMILIDPLPGHTSSRALAVNGSLIVGVSSDIGGWSAPDTPMTDFGHYSDGNRRAFLYETACGPGRLHALEDLVVAGDPFDELLEAADVNDRGQIVGWALVGGQEHAVLLTLTCPWDLDGDGAVGIVDFLAVLAAWGTNPGGPPDFDGDGDVGIADFLALLANWGPCP